MIELDALPSLRIPILEYRPRHPKPVRRRAHLTTRRLRSEIISGSIGRHVPLLSLHTPVGDISVAEEDGAIVSVDWGWGRDQDETALLMRARTQLDAYFDGDLTAFDLPLAPKGSPYRQRVWKALLAIPYGATRSYLDIARDAGGSPRSVGGANGANPIPIIIPCHRVVATNGPGGYSGGEGLPTKRALLTLEDPSGASPLWNNLQARLL